MGDFPKFGHIFLWIYTSALEVWIQTKVLSKTNNLVILFVVYISHEIQVYISKPQFNGVK